MNKTINTLAIGACMIGLVGCAGMNKQDMGTVSGGVLGGLVGSQFGHGGGQVAAAVGGTLVGAYIGNAIGRNMDDMDRMKMSQALEKNRTNQPVSWSNPDNGNSYTVVPKKTYYNNANQPCREYTQTAMIAGKRQQVYGRACRNADGNWKIVS
jgi:surface antigen